MYMNDFKNLVDMALCRIRTLRQLYGNSTELQPFDIFCSSWTSIDGYPDSLVKPAGLNFTQISTETLRTGMGLAF